MLVWRRCGTPRPPCPMLAGAVENVDRSDLEMHGVGQDAGNFGDDFTQVEQRRQRLAELRDRCLIVELRAVERGVDDTLNPAAQGIEQQGKKKYEGVS